MAKKHGITNEEAKEEISRYYGFYYQQNAQAEYEQAKEQGASDEEALLAANEKVNSLAEWIRRLIDPRRK